MARGMALALLWSCLVAAPAVVRADIELWPFLEVSETSTTVLYPLYVHEENFLMIFPFFYRTNAGRDYDFLWPLVKISNGRLRRLLPIYATFGQWEVVPPSFYRARQEGKSSRMGLWPIWEYSVLPETKTFSLLRFMKASWGDESAEFSLLPLFSWKRAASSWSLWVTILYLERAEEVGEFTLYPFFSRWRDGDEKGLWIAPFLYKRSEDTLKTWFFGLFDRRYAPGKAPDERISSLRLLGVGPFTVYSRHSVTKLDGQTLARKVRFLMFSHERERSGARVLRIFGIPVAKRSPSAEIPYP